MLLDLFENIVAEHAQNIAIEFEQYKINYSKLQEIINRLANGLQNLGIKKGDRIAILLPNVPHFIFSYYAILKIGAIIVPINFLLKKDEIQFIIKDTQPNVLILWEGFYNLITRTNKEFQHIITLGTKIPFRGKSLTNLITTSANEEPMVEINPEDTAIIQYSSEIPDTALGIELSHNNLFAAALGSINLFSTNSLDVRGGLLPLFLSYSQNMIMNAALLQGAKILLYPRLDVQTLSRAIYEDKITFLAGSPAVYNILLEDDIEAINSNSLKHAVSFGAVCNEEIQKRFEQKFGLPILEGYGLTEASAIISCNRPLSKSKHGSVGLPIDGVKIKIIDENGKKVQPGEIGEIVVAGKNIMKGYWNQPEKTNEVIRDGWLYTGDLGKIDEDGFLFFIDRKEDVILKGGFQIYPRDIEHIIKKHPKVDQVSIVAIAHPTHKQDVKACIVLKKNQKATPEEIIEYCKQHIPLYKCPQVVQFYESFPKSSMGKIIKRRLREQI